jgi:hypothetical protein
MMSGSAIRERYGTVRSAKERQGSRVIKRLLGRCHACRGLIGRRPEAATRSIGSPRPLCSRSRDRRLDGVAHLMTMIPFARMSVMGERPPWRTKKVGPCSNCGMVLPADVLAHWDQRGRRLYCLDCARRLGLLGSPQIRSAAPLPFDSGAPGGSARAKSDRLRAQRKSHVRARWGDRVGGWVLRFSDEQLSIRAWGIGAAGEEALGRALGDVPGLWVLNDRAVADTRGNIDHILVAPAGVFVVDAKNLSGSVDVRNVGGWLRTDVRLFVGRRDRSEMAEGLGWQVAAVRAALGHIELPTVPPIVPVLCFINPQWPMFRRPKEFAGVRLESPKSLIGLLNEPVALAEDEIERIARHLAEVLPPR